MLKKEELEMILIEAVKRFEDKNGKPGIHRDDILELVNEMGGDKNDFYYVMQQAFDILCCGEEMPEKRLS
ncbi:MAG: hypothetical protein ACI4LZ_00355 [Anaerovoracaceae bacterium]